LREIPTPAFTKDVVVIAADSEAVVHPTDTAYGTEFHSHASGYRTVSLRTALQVPLVNRFAKQSGHRRSEQMDIAFNLLSQP
jgi:hypothetical protein